MIEVREWRESIEDYISWKVGEEYIERLKAFDELFAWLSINNFSVGSKPSKYIYINKNIKEFRANIYYKKVGIAKVTLKIDFDNLYENNIIIRKINKLEHNCYRLRDISYELELLWTNLFDISIFNLPERSNSLINSLSKLIDRLNYFICEEEEVNFANALDFVHDLINSNIISYSELTEPNNEVNTINVIKK